MSITLKGMTWSHPRGYDPMLATARLWQQQTGIKVVWDKRSLQDFESHPVEELARAYDLIVIDHPHVGQITAENCLAPLDVPGREAKRAAMERHSVGRSYPSYGFEGRQWAFPIDAATQVLAHRADLLPQPPRTWDEVIALAKAGKVTLPLRPPHSILSFFTLAANIGHPCAAGDELIAPDVGARVVALLRAVTDHLDPTDFARDPIDASEALSQPGTTLSVMPLGYGYVSYALDGFRPHRLSFADIAAAGANGPIGSALGGTGIAVSAFSAHRSEAINLAYWLAGADIQKSLYATSGGQPGHGLAWEDESVNAPSHGFYRNTRATLEGAYVRPRHNGYMAFQAKASERLNAGLVAREPASTLVADLNALFRASL